MGATWMRELATLIYAIQQLVKEHKVGMERLAVDTRAEFNKMTQGVEEFVWNTATFAGEAVRDPLKETGARS